MSRNAWIGAGILVLIVIIGVVAYAMQGPHSMDEGMYPADTATTTTATSSLPTGTSTSDASLNADLNSVDSQMSGFNSDDSAASQSVSDEQNPSAQ